MTNDQVRTALENLMLTDLTLTARTLTTDIQAAYDLIDSLPDFMKRSDPVREPDPVTLVIPRRKISWSVDIALGISGALAIMLITILFVAAPTPTPMLINDHMYENALKILLGQPPLTPLN